MEKTLVLHINGKTTSFTYKTAIFILLSNYYVAGTYDKVM